MGVSESSKPGACRRLVDIEELRKQTRPVSRLIDIAELVAKHAGGPGHDQKSHGNWARGYGAKVRDSSPSWRGAFDAQNARTIENNARKHGMTVDEYKAAIEAEMKTFVESAEVCIRCRPEAIERFIADGRYKTKFETDDSRDLPDVRARAHIESEVFGYPGDLDPRERPVYGYLQQGAESLERNYGSTVIHLADSVRLRATYCYGDTLANTDKAGSASLAPAPLTAPSYRAGCYRAHGDIKMDPLGIRNQADLLRHGVPYAEVQIHGGVSLADVRKVSFAAGTVLAQTTVDELAALGILVEERP